MHRDAIGVVTFTLSSQLQLLLGLVLGHGQRGGLLVVAFDVGCH